MIHNHPHDNDKYKYDKMSYIPDHIASPFHAVEHVDLSYQD